MSLFKNTPQPKSKQQGAETDNSHLLQDLLAHRPLPSMTTDIMSMSCYVNIKYICCFAARWYSRSLLWCQQHLYLLWYPNRQQVSYSFTEQVHFHTEWEWAFSAKGLVTLTFSPGRPLSPATPGNVWPGIPCINHKEEICHLHSATLFCFIIYNSYIHKIHLSFLYGGINFVLINLLY